MEANQHLETSLEVVAICMLESGSESAILVCVDGGDVGDGSFQCDGGMGF
jgi:hypothetical protein